MTKQIRAWRQTVESAAIEIVRIQDYEDGCVKIDFHVNSTIANGAGEKLPVQVGVMAIYMLDGDQIVEMGEFWQKVPPAAREHQ